VLSVSEVGPFVGNAGSSPPGHTAVIDYVFDTSAPIVPEDSDALSCVKLSELAANLGTAVGGAIQVR
jgi:hypothetical protein